MKNSAESPQADRNGRRATGCAAWSCLYQLVAACYRPADVTGTRGAAGFPITLDICQNRFANREAFNVKTEGHSNSGHLFIINGDLKQLHCDAWLLPTDQLLSVTPAFSSVFDTFGELGDPSNPSVRWIEGCALAIPHTQSGGPDIWIGDVGRDPRTDITHFTQRAQAFISQASQRASNRLGDKRPPLIALPALGTGDGGHRSKRGPLLKGLIPTLLAAAGENRCDVVLVTYGQVMYTAAQKVRRELSATNDDYWAELPHDLWLLADQLAEKAHKKQLVTFFGAGVGADVGRPTWLELLERIARSAENFDMNTFSAIKGMDPRDQATIIERIAGEHFREAVEEALASERYSLTHGLLASLPVDESVTTNFDDLYERAARIDGRSLAVFPGGDLSAGDRWLLKLHGTIGRDIILTRDEYLGAISSHVALRGLVQAMLFTRTMLFVGYSLRDEDFHQLVHEVRSALGTSSRKTMGTVLMIEPAPYLDLLWDELDVVSMTDYEPAVKDAAAARRLTIFLDRLGASAASDTMFIADDSMGDMRSSEEQELARIVADLRGLYDKRDENRSHWANVKTFLDGFKNR